MERSPSRPAGGRSLDSVFAALAVVLIVLLPFTASAVPPQDVSWSALDPNLIYVRSSPSSVQVTASGMTLLAPGPASGALVNVASMGTGTILDLDAQFSLVPGDRPLFSVTYSSPYDKSSCGMTFDATRSAVLVASTNATGAPLFQNQVASFDPASPFHVRASFVPGQPFLFAYVQGAASAEPSCLDPGLASTIPVNVDLDFDTGRGPSSLHLSELQLTLPAATNRTYAALDGTLLLQYALILVFAVLGFRAPLRRFLARVAAARSGLRRRLVQFPRKHKRLLAAFVLAFPVQILMSFLGSHPYDMFTEELWTYIAPRYGVVSTVPMSLLVPGGKAVGFASPIGSFYPYPPLTLYLFDGLGSLGAVLDPTAGVPSPLLLALVKLAWLLFLDLTAWVVYRALLGKGLSRRTALGVGLLVALNPGLLINSVVWGHFEIVVAFFLVLSFAAFGRDRPVYAFFFLLLALLTKQTALLFAAFLLPVYLASWGPRRGAVALGKALVGAFVVLLPLFLAGLSPAYVVRDTVGDIILAGLAPSPAAVAPWQRVVSSGAFNLWPLVTGLANGQMGLARLQYPDYLPGQAFGLPYVLLGDVLAAVAFVAFLAVILYARAKGRLGYETSLLVVLAGFLCAFEVTTRMSGRYVSIAVPLIALLWSSRRTVRLARVLMTLTTVILVLSLLAILGLTALQVPFALSALEPSSILVLSDGFVTLLASIQLAVVLLAVFAVARAVRGRSLWAFPSYAARLTASPAPDPPKVSVIVLNYNGGGFTRACVDSVLRGTYPNQEVIVVDNASSDDSVDRLSDLVAQGRIRLIRNEANLQFAEGNNRGATPASGDLLLFLNNDTEVEPGMVGALVARFRADPDLGAAQPLVLCLPETQLVNSAGNSLDTLAFHEVLGLRRARDGYPVTGRTSYAAGAALMIRRGLFHHVGGFDAQVRAYYTDADLSWKVWLAGFRVAVVPEAVAYHAEGAAARHLGSEVRLRMMVASQLMVVAKNYEAELAIVGSVTLVLLDTLMAFMYLLKGDRVKCRAVLLAIGLFGVSLRQILLRRRQVAAFRTISDKEAKASFLAPFNPVAVFLRKREGWGYPADLPSTRLT